MSAPDPREARARIAVLVVIVNYKSAGLTVACLRSLAPEIAADPRIRVVVVENDSGEGDALGAALLQNGWCGWASVMVAEHNGGFAYGNNRAIESALLRPEPPDYFLLLNPDTEIRTGAVTELVTFMDAHPRVGVAGSRFEDQDRVDWPIAFRFPSVWSEFEQALRFGPISRLLRSKVVSRVMGEEPARVDWVSGASMIVRRRVLEEIGLMDERFFLYFEEVDLCLRARRAGWPCWYVPHSRVMHLFGQTTGVSGQERTLKPMPTYWFASRSLYFIKNHGLAYARLADLAFGVGLALCALRRLLVARTDPDPPGMLADFWRTSILLLSRRAVVRRLAERAGVAPLVSDLRT